MRKRETEPNMLRGKIINMSSMRGLKGRANFGAYSVSKAGVLSLTQKAMIERIEKAGGSVAVVYSVQDVIEACIDWNVRK